MKLQNQSYERSDGHHVLFATVEELKLLKNLIKEAKKIITVEPTEPKKDIQPYQGFFNRRIKERRSPVVSKRAGERCTLCGRRTLVSRRKL